MPGDISSADLTVALNLLRRHSSLDVASQFLKDKGLSYSATSWAEMKDKRIVPALESNSLSRADIVKLVRSAEEFGRQHVFLYKCSKQVASEMVNDVVLAKNIKKMNLTELVTRPRLVDVSKGLELVDVRIDLLADRRALVIKAVDARGYRKLVDKSITDDREVLTYEWQYERAVNTISIGSDGLIEVRIQSHRNSIDYAQQAEEMLFKANGLVDPLRFSPLSLTKARLYFLENRSKFAGTIRFADNILRDKDGNQMSLASGGIQQNLYEVGSSADKSLTAFLSVGKPTCDEIDCFWLKRTGQSPSTDVHTLIAGANNEFALTAQSTEADYAYVLEQITKYTN